MSGGEWDGGECKRHADTAAAFAGVLDRLASGDRISKADLAYLVDDCGWDRADISRDLPGDVFDRLWGDSVLEAYGRARLGIGGTVDLLEEVVIVTGIGGPHVEIVVEESGDCRAVCYWGLDKADSVAWCESLARYVFGWFGEFVQ